MYAHIFDSQAFIVFAKFQYISLKFMQTFISKLQPLLGISTPKNILSIMQKKNVNLRQFGCTDS